MSGCQTEQERGDDANTGDREHQVQQVDDQVQNSSANPTCVEGSQRRNEKSNDGRKSWRFHLRCVKQQLTLKSVHGSLVRVGKLFLRWRLSLWIVYGRSEPADRWHSQAIASTLRRSTMVIRP